MKRWLKQVEDEIRERKLFRDNASILVAVSGGLDSMVLLHVLKALASAHGWSLAVAHFNHKLRGVHSDHDEELVSQTARKLGLPFFVGAADVKDHAVQAGLSIEMAARSLRHDFLAASALKCQSTTIALAHHAGDQVELFFLRVLRGAGTQGLSGMKWTGPSPANATLLLVRPFLGQSKSDLAAFAQSEKVLFSEDASNDVLDIPRNRIRHELIPLLEKEYQPALTRTTLRLMELVGAESDFVTQAAEQLTPHIVFRDLPVALQRRHLQSQLFTLKLPVDFDLVEQLRLSPGSLISVEGGQGIFCDAEGQIQVQKPTNAQFAPISCSISLDSDHGPRKIDFEGLKLDWSLCKGGPSLIREPNREFFDADKVGSTIQLRHWQPGDRFQPIGANAPSKLQDLFTNLKVSQAERHQRIVAVSQSGLLFWVEGLRISECFKLDKRSVRWLNWHWCR